MWEYGDGKENCIGKKTSTKRRFADVLVKKSNCKFNGMYYELSTSTLFTQFLLGKIQNHKFGRYAFHFFNSTIYNIFEKIGIFSEQL